MRILILLPGRPVAANDSTEGANNLIEGLDIFDNKHCFSKFELVNNMLTVQAIKNAYPAATIYIRHFINRNNPIQLYLGSRQLIKWCTENDIKLVHQFWGGPGAWATARGLKIPYILSLLGSDLYGSYNVNGNKTLKGKMLALFSKLAAGRATKVVVMSNNMRKALPAIVQDKSVVIPEGISVEKFYPLDKEYCRQKLSWGLSEKVILFFDNGNRVKNAPLAFEALSLVKESIPDASIYTAKSIPHHELIYY